MSVFIGPGYAVTVRHRSSGNMGWVLDRIDHTHDLLEFGPVTILHSVLDNAVDEYLGVIDEVTADIAGIEESVFSPSEMTTQRKSTNLSARTWRFGERSHRWCRLRGILVAAKTLGCRQNYVRISATFPTICCGLVTVSRTTTVCCSPC